MRPLVKNSHIQNYACVFQFKPQTLNLRQGIYVLYLFLKGMICVRLFYTIHTGHGSYAFVEFHDNRTYTLGWEDSQRNHRWLGWTRHHRRGRLIAPKRFPSNYFSYGTDGISRLGISLPSTDRPTSDTSHFWFCVQHLHKIKSNAVFPERHPPKYFLLSVLLYFNVRWYQHNVGNYSKKQHEEYFLCMNWSVHSGDL